MAALVGVALVSDWTENVLLLRRLDAWWRVLDTRGVLRADDLGLTAVHVVGWIKWTALAVVVIGVVLVFGLRQLARAGRAVLRALPALWLQLLIVALFTLAVAVPDQSADAIRRLSLGQWAFTLSVTAVFSFVLLATALGALRPTTPRPARDTSDMVWSGLPVLALGVVVIAASRLTSFRGLLVPGLIITAVGLVSLVLDVLARRESGARVMLERADSDARADGEPRAPEPPERAVDRRHVAVALALTPVAVFGIAAVRSSAGDVALLGAGPSGRVAAAAIRNLKLEEDEDNQGMSLDRIDNGIVAEGFDGWDNYGFRKQLGRGRVDARGHPALFSPAWTDDLECRWQPLCRRHRCAANRVGIEQARQGAEHHSGICSLTRFIAQG